MKERLDRFFIVHCLQRAFLDHDKESGREISIQISALEAGWWLKSSKDYIAHEQVHNVCLRLYKYIQYAYTTRQQVSEFNQKAELEFQNVRTGVERMSSSIVIAFHALHHIVWYRRLGFPDAVYVADHFDQWEQIVPWVHDLSLLSKAS